MTENKTSHHLKKTRSFVALSVVLHLPQTKRGADLSSVSSVAADSLGVGYVALNEKPRRVGDALSSAEASGRNGFKLLRRPEAPVRSRSRTRIARIIHAIDERLEMVGCRTKEMLREE
ncbi:uncharacterized protein IUM83_13929 [Phytophthora cinnamomi]|uniref:uncharacterized protein n=1 Tax=Phytophthora cinnamomi TaxID=4785 RepID=UPI00355A3538|nr:hypothetical protein IUM83_13929 [Phytophthora cinnamomi]